MAVAAMTDARIWIGQFDLVDTTNDVSVDVEYAELDKTNFGSGGKREVTGGLKMSSATISGFLDFAEDSSDEGLATVAAVPRIAPGTDNVITIAQDDAAGSTALLMEGLEMKVARGAKVGELSTFTANLSGSASPGIVEGILLAAEQTQTTTTSVAGIQHGAVASGETAYAALHVFAASGTPTLDVTIESDDNSGFSSATTRMTFTQATGATSEWKSVAGAITDDYWRVVATIGGSTPSFTFAVSFGIA